MDCKNIIKVLDLNCKLKIFPQPMMMMYIIVITERSPGGASRQVLACSMSPQLRLRAKNGIDLAWNLGHVISPVQLVRDLGISILSTQQLLCVALL